MGGRLPNEMSEAMEQKNRERRSEVLTELLLDDHRVMEEAEAAYNDSPTGGTRALEAAFRAAIEATERLVPFPLPTQPVIEADETPRWLEVDGTEGAKMGRRKEGKDA